MNYVVLSVANTLQSSNEWIVHKFKQLMGKKLQLNFKQKW